MDYSFLRKQCITILNDFQKFLDESRHKPNIKVDKGGESTKDQWSHGCKTIM